MSALSSARTLVARRMASRVPVSRAFSVLSSVSAEKKPISSEPYKVTAAPQFPPPVDPFAAQEAIKAAESSSEPAPTPKAPQEYSEGAKTIVRGVARLMGYNSKTTTAIRETGRMMRGAVEAVEAERSFWYDTCALPPTYQTFFQLHLLYVLLLVVRLRSIPPGAQADRSPVPESIEPGTPQDPPSRDHASSGGISITKPAHEAYPAELLNHFFELAESQMRMVLGRGERESVIRKYMDEMGEQWKGAGMGLDYALGLGLSEDPAERSRADTELASWVWRNLFSSRGLTAPPAAGEEKPAINELDFIAELELVVRFIRRELSRLDAISDRDVVDGNIGQWGPVEQRV